MPRTKEHHTEARGIGGINPPILVKKNGGGGHKSGKKEGGGLSLRKQREEVQNFRRGL